MTLIHRPDGWWITGLADCDDCGPYTTRAEADDDRRGLERCEKYGHRPGYVTVDKAKP